MSVGKRMCGFHGRWHQSYTRESSQGKASSAGKHFLKGINVKTGCHFLTDGMGCFVVGYRTGRICYDSAEDLIVYVAVKMCPWSPVGEAGAGFQHHKGIPSRRTENVLASKTLLRQACFFCHTVKRKYGMESAKLYLRGGGECLKTQKSTGSQ